MSDNQNTNGGQYPETDEMTGNSKRYIGIKQAELLGAHRRTAGRQRAAVSRKRIATACAAIAAGSAFLNAVSASAATNTYTHTNTGGQLGNATFWSAGGPPTSTDIGLFNNTITTGQTESLGGNHTIGEVQITNSGGSITVADSIANILTINGVGGVGIDMSSVSNGTNNLTINASLALGGNQTWNVDTGRSITLSGQSNVTGNSSTIANGSNNLTISGGGAVNFSYYNGVVVASGSGSYTFNGSTVTTTLLLGNQTFLGGTNALGTGSLTLAGSTLSSNSQNNSGVESQTFSSLTLNAGFSNLTASHGTSAQDELKFSALPTRNDGGVVNLYADPGGSYTNTYVGIGGTTNSVFGYATVGSNDWAKTNGSVTNAVSAVAYANDTWAAANNTTVTANDTPGTDNTTNTLRFNAAGAFTVSLSGNNTITTGGILVGSGVGANTSTITGGNLTSGNTNADGTHDLIIINNNTTAGSNVVINSNIVNNGGTVVGLTAAVTTATAVTGNISLGGTNTFSGAAYIDGATVILTSPGAWNGQAALNFAPAGSLGGATGSLSLGGNSITLSGLSTTQSGMTAIVQNANAGAAILTINAAGTTTFGGMLQDGTGGGTLGLIKAGVGSQTLNGANTYTGPTTINGGTLRAANANALGNGTVAINSAGTLALGADTSTVGTLTTGNDTWSTGGTYTPKITGAGAGNATLPAAASNGTLDLLTMPGLTVNSTNGSKFAIVLTAGATPTGNFTSSLNYDWTIAAINGSATGISPGVLATANSSGNSVSSGSNIFSLDTTGFVAANSGIGSSASFLLELEGTSGAYSLDVVYNATPEPGAMMLVLAGAVPMLTARRRRRRQASQTL
jgi:fibronectin-binding autotransporter adhesin